jgi:hypothetical protein
LGVQKQWYIVDSSARIPQYATGKGGIACHFNATTTDLAACLSLPAAVSHIKPDAQRDEVPAGYIGVERAVALLQRRGLRLPIFFGEVIEK